MKLPRWNRYDISGIIGVPTRKQTKPCIRVSVVLGIFFYALLNLVKTVHGDDTVAAANPPTELRIFTIGNSFHAWLPYWLNLVEAETDIKGHIQVGISYISGSRAIAHWQVPDDKNKAKAALTAGNVDVVTMDAMLSPDEGIDDFATLGLQHNPNIRIAFEEF
jgi:hypothetical protein